MLHNIYRENEVTCVLKRRLTAVAPFSRNKSHIKYQDIEIKQHSQVTYLGCVMDETMFGEPTALKVIRKINGKLKFLYRKNSFLTPGLRRMLCNALIQPHFNYACSKWYPNLNVKLKQNCK